MTLSIKSLCHYTECSYVEFRVLFIVVLSVIMLNVMTPWHQVYTAIAVVQDSGKVHANKLFSPY